MKGVNSGYLAIDIVEVLSILTSIGKIVSYVALAVVVAVIGLVILFRKYKGFARFVTQYYTFLQNRRISLASIALAFALALTALFLAFKNSQSFREYVQTEAKHIITAESLEKIRNNTKPGDLVLCWKWCIAFYADKRSITDATVDDLDYYREHNLHSVMGPVRPLNNYYKRIENYPEPMSYWRPMTDEELRARHKKRGARRRKEK